MRIQAVCVCDGYADFLRYTLPQMKIAFDFVVVVTSRTDLETAQICRKNNTPWMVVDAVQRDGRFEKGRAINKALKYFHGRDWVVQIDADIWLPSTFGRLVRWNLAQMPDRERYIVGMRRRIVRGFSAFEQFRSSLQALDADTFWGPEPFEKLVMRHGVPLPIGFFQMWNPQGSGVSSYCEGHTLSEIEDVRFALQWKPSYRIVRGLHAYHLETEAHYPMQDWNGRRQPRFGPEMNHGRA